jgi:hypothetical protein
VDCGIHWYFIFKKILNNTDRTQILHHLRLNLNETFNAIKMISVVSVSNCKHSYQNPNLTAIKPIIESKNHICGHKFV